jgi:hypothetical protein
MSAKRLSDLKPEWYEIMRDFTPETGGFPTGNFSLSFTCPSCGPPYQIIINLTQGPADEPKRFWHMNVAPSAENYPHWPDLLTVAPSINNTTAGHGRKHPTCNFHGVIAEGIIKL